MNLKGKKTMNIIVCIICIIVGGVIGCITMALVSANKLSEVKYDYDYLLDQYNMRLNEISDLENEKEHLENLVEIESRAGKTYLCAALGSAYGKDIGDTWHVTLNDGGEFDIILADCKGDDAGSEFGHKCNNYDGDECINVIEFVVDPDYVDEDVKDAGTFSRLECFGGLKGSGGNIAKMEYTGRVWTRN